MDCFGFGRAGVVIVDIHSLWRIWLRRFVEIGAIKGLGLFCIKSFKALQSSPRCHDKGNIKRRPGVGDQLYATQIIDCGFNLLLQIRAAGFIQNVAVLPEDDIPMFQIMNKIASRKLIIVIIKKTRLSFLRVMRTRGRRVGVVLTGIATD